MTDGVESSLLLERLDGWARITLNRPKFSNAADLDLWRRIGDVVADLEADPAVGVIVITGAGERAFMAGADMTEFPAVLASPANIKNYLDTVSRACDMLEKIGTPVIAQINGAAIGGGLELAVACDYRLAVDTAKFGIPSADVGLGLAYADIERLLALVGTNRTREMLLFSRVYSAGEALGMGLVNELVPREHLAARTQELVQTLLEKAPMSIRSAKQVMHAWIHNRQDVYGPALRSIYEAWESDEMRRRVEKRLGPR